MMTPDIKDMLTVYIKTVSLKFKNEMVLLDEKNDKTQNRYNQFLLLVHIKSCFLRHIGDNSYSILLHTDFSGVKIPIVLRPTFVLLGFTRM